MIRFEGRAGLSVVDMLDAADRLGNFLQGGNCPAAIIERNWKSHRIREEERFVFVQLEMRQETRMVNVRSPSRL